MFTIDEESRQSTLLGIGVLLIILGILATFGISNNSFPKDANIILLFILPVFSFVFGIGFVVFSFRKKRKE